MSRRNKNTTLNLNINADDMLMIISALRYTRGEQLNDLFAENYTKLIDKLDRALCGHNIRKGIRYAERKTESGTPEGETSQSPGVLQMRSEGVSHNADGNRPVPEMHGEGNSQQ